ncbi:MAG: YdiU family protein [Pigmentiphaga sp.]
MPVLSLDQLHWRNRFAQLPDTFYTRLAPKPLRNPRLVHASEDIAQWLGLDPAAFATPAFVETLAGNRPIQGSDPLAAVYSGHQFGVWAGQLGDGRALLLGEVEGPGGRFELQLKGSGLTPYSRMGDGRAVLRSSIREHLASIAMHGLGIPTTHSLALIAAEDPIRRETLETAAIVTRVAPSFIRFGSFQHWAARGDLGSLRILLDHVLEHHYPECRESTLEATVERLLREVVARTARLMAQWQAVGFMHGVMNTDNLSILGLTLDYGPYGFMDGFDANHICNHTDTAGRYAWNVQPAVAHWNLYRLAEALRPLLADEQALRRALDTFEAAFLQAFQDLLAAKLGLGRWQAADQELLDTWWQLLHAQRADFTLAFRRLAWADQPPRPGEPGTDAHEAAGGNAGHWLDLFYDTHSAAEWLERYRQRLAQDARPAEERRTAMLAVNPLYVLRNHMAETAIRTSQTGDDQEVRRLAQVLRQPFDARPEAAGDAEPPPEWARTLAVSCSS